MGDTAVAGGAGAMEAALGGLWEDNGAGDEGRPQRPIGRVVVGWAERRLD